jgi:aromatic-L-amino-acid decarboxylase
VSLTEQQDLTRQGNEDLDPSDWEELRALAHRMLDDSLDYLRDRREQPVWQPMPEEARRALQAPLPEGGEPLERIYEDYKRHVVPYAMGNTHPRFWAWVMGNGTVEGVLADMLASTLNPNMGGASHSGPEVERQVIEWCKEMLGFPQSASGILMSGGSMANLVGLAVARHALSGIDVRGDGMQALPAPLTVYCSAEGHSSIQRAVELLGLGDRYLRRIPVDEADRLDMGALQRAINEDLAAGLKPLAVVGNAASTNTGAIDPLDEIADLAAEHGLWFHVDGAFGALAYLAPSLRHLVKGMERADSLSFDLHKLGYLSFEVGCTLVRDAEAHYRTFTVHPDYLERAARGLAGGDRWLSDYTPQLTRGFRALKVWMSLRTHGTHKLGRVIEQNVRQAGYLASLVEAEPRLELLAPVGFNVVCFRYHPAGVPEEHLNALNSELFLRLQESGVAAPSGTNVRGRFAIRCSITNHRTRDEDLDLLVREVLRLGGELLAQGWPAGK